MARIPPVSEEEEGKVNSEENPSHTSSSSLRFSTDDDETECSPNGRRNGKTFEELAAEAIRDMREAEEDEGKRPEEITQIGEPSQSAEGVNNEDPHEGLIREILDLTGNDDEENAEEDEWRRSMEEKVATLVAENAEQREQLTKLVDMMERIVSLMDRENHSSNNLSPAASVAPQRELQQPNANLAEPSRKRNDIATIS